MTVPRPGVPVPPDDLINSWWNMDTQPTESRWSHAMARQGAEWGADEQLRLCAEWLRNSNSKLSLLAHYMETELRPKPRSLKEEALKAFYRRRAEQQYYRDAYGNEALLSPDLYADMDLIEEALKALPGD